MPRDGLPPDSFLLADGPADEGLLGEGLSDAGWSLREDAAGLPAAFAGLV